MKTRPAPKALGYLVIAGGLSVFGGWVALYLIVLRPVLLQFIMSSMGWETISFPAMLHLVPIIGIPVVIMIILVKLTGSKPAAEAQLSDSQRK